MPDRSPIEIESLTVQFGGRRIVNQFSLAVAPGERVTICGESGVGKTTVLRCLMGFAAPLSGSVRIDGQPLDSNSVWPLRRRIAYVQQEPELGRGTVREILERPFEYRANVALRKNLDRLPQHLERFHLPQRLLDEDASSLSGGEKQRLAIIAAIVLDRPIHLLDEPASALDGESRRAVIEYYQERAELTVLCAAHDPRNFPLPSRVVRLGGEAGEGTDAGD